MAKFRGSGNIDDCLCLCFRHSGDMEELRRFEHRHMVCQHAWWSAEFESGRLLAVAGQPAFFSVPVDTLVFPVIHLDTVSRAGIPNQVEFNANAPGSDRRARLPDQYHLRIFGSGDGAWLLVGSIDCQPDFFHGCPVI